MRDQAAEQDAHTSKVQSLFDTKAATWPDKYADGGRLTGRLARLASAAAELASPAGKVLDLGCGSGELARSLASAGFQVTGCDISTLMIRQAVAADHEHAVRWLLLQPDWRRLPFPGGSLDLIVASSVLEYVPDPLCVLAECARLLRPEGVMLCTVPSFDHAVRWVEWPLGLAARTSLCDVAATGGPRAVEYLGYLRTSRHRHRVGWWHAAGRRAGLAPRPMPRTAREPLRLLAFTPGQR
jgi:SAM-dependent methyltransferase